MKEQVIEFETAKLAKEKGFPTLEYGYEYNKEGQVVDPTFSKGGYSIPTQSLLQKWLRELHNVDVQITSYRKHNQKVYSQEVYYGDFINNSSVRKTARENSVYITFSKYEEALEKGLKEALINII
jgi:hypothetical protein